MGWWTQDTQGHSFGEGGGVWGDGPADLVSGMIEAVVREFQADWNRMPSKAEIRRGLEFSLAPLDHLPDDTADDGVPLGGLLNRVPEEDDPRG